MTEQLDRGRRGVLAAHGCIETHDLVAPIELDERDVSAN
jgi:hypothetical protein